MFGHNSKIHDLKGGVTEGLVKSCSFKLAGERFYEGIVVLDLALDALHIEIGLRDVTGGGCRADRGLAASFEDTFLCLKLGYLRTYALYLRILLSFTLQ